jgi:DnaJ family protein B protein 13|tara:strand:- start:507 stop:617 length:111 start_codon:yes stop_codon:yes gene_type:complete
MYHPDKDPTEDAALIFKRVAEAYDVLSDGARVARRT